MAFNEAGGFCEDCRENVLTRSKAYSNASWIVFSAVFLFLGCLNWLFFIGLIAVLVCWILGVALHRPKWVCIQCGSREIYAREKQRKGSRRK